MTELTCPFCCNEKFTCHSALKYHILSIVDNLLCPACNGRFESLVELADHIGRECKDEHETEEPIVIKIENHNQLLEEEFEGNEDNGEEETIENIQLHIEETSNVNQSILEQALMLNSENEEKNDGGVEETLYNCQMCNMNFNNIQEHLEKYHEGEEVVLTTENSPIIQEEINYQCNKCSENFSSKARMRYHRKKCGKVFKCISCNKLFKTPFGLKRHYKYVHKKEKPISCPKCDKQFVCLAELKMHFNKHANIRFNCDFCTVSFSNIYSKKYHVRKYHANDENIIQPIDKEKKDEGTISSENVPVKRKRNRTGVIRECHCGVCGRKFSLGRRMRFHQKSCGKITKCTICDKSFSTPYKLKLHNKFVHNKERPFSCPKCDQKCTSNSALKQHLIVHEENVKRHECEHCESSFASIASKRRHIKKFHAENNSIDNPIRLNCDHCEKSFSNNYNKSQHIKRFHTEDAIKNEETDEEKKVWGNKKSSALKRRAFEKKETEEAHETNDLDNELAEYVDMEHELDEEDQVVMEEEEEEGEEGAEGEETIQQQSNNKKVLNEKQCIDKEGRLYMRKIVKIDKFWEMENVVEMQEPSAQKYMVNNGKVKVLTEEEVATIEMEGKEKVRTIYKCDMCALQFPSTDVYYKHKCSWMNTKFKCTHCKAVFQNYKSLHNHIKYHVDKDPTGEVRRTVTVGPFVCEVCNTLFPSFKSLRLHKRMHDPIKTKEPEAPVNYTISGATIDANKEESIRNMFVCNICNNTYDKEYEEIHMKSHTYDDNFDCDVCNRKFFTQENLDMHMKAHSNGKKFACSYCKKGFISFDSLQNHVKTQCQKRRYECQYCGRRFARPHEKVKHERIHTGEKPHVCQLCGKCFRVSYCLTLHMRTHSGQRPYKCVHCDKRFKSHSVYNHHLLTHSDVRGYPCPYCPKAFKTSVQLAGHKNSHTKPFACNECNRPFASLYAVRAHMETHKRENNLKYNCNLCGATYARSFALRDHLKAQHGGDEAHTEILGMPENQDLFIELETAVSTQAIQTEMEVEVGQKDD